MKDTIKSKYCYRVLNSVDVNGFPVAVVFDGNKFLFKAERRSYAYYKDEKDSNKFFVFYEVFTTFNGKQFIYWGDTLLDVDYISLIE